LVAHLIWAVPQLRNSHTYTHILQSGFFHDDERVLAIRPCNVGHWAMLPRRAIVFANILLNRELD